MTLWTDARKALVCCDQHMNLLDKKTTKVFDREGECTVCLQKGGPIKFRIVLGNQSNTEVVEPVDLVNRLFEISKQGTRWVVVKE